MALALFAEIHVRDFQAVKRWYVQLLGKPFFAAHETAEVWELAENRSIAVEEPLWPTRSSPAASSPHTRETYGNGVRKVTFHDPDGNEIGFGGPPF